MGKTPLSSFMPEFLDDRYAPARFREGPPRLWLLSNSPTRQVLFSTRLMEKSRWVCGKLTDVDCTSSLHCAARDKQIALVLCERSAFPTCFLVMIVTTRV